MTMSSSFPRRRRTLFVEPAQMSDPLGFAQAAETSPSGLSTLAGAPQSPTPEAAALVLGVGGPATSSPDVPA